MNRVSVELIPDLDFGGFTARIPDIPAYGEGETEEAAIADLQVALRGYIETFGLGRRFPNLATFRESQGVAPHSGNTILASREEERA
jgi:predicted RNase H-like HicB family nuclease